jgi:hypothetical protein
MIKRIVKLNILPGKEDRFRAIFNESKLKISAFEGCSKLELLQDINNPNIFFTYSIWNDLEQLNKYRSSDLFINVWSQVKLIFGGKPEAWSLN